MNTQTIRPLAAPAIGCNACRLEPPGHIRYCLLHAAAPELLTALETIAETTHHIRLDGKGTHAPNCPPCVAAAAIRKATEVL